MHFHRNTGQDLLALGAATGKPGLVPTEVGLIDLHHPAEQIPARPHQHRPQPVQHGPHGVIRTDLQRPLQAQRRHPVLAGREHPAHREPDRQRGTRPVEDRARGHRRTTSAGPALEPAIAQPPPTSLTTRGTHETSRPAQPLQVVQAVGVTGEPGPKLAQRRRVVRVRSRMAHGLKSTPVNCIPLRSEICLLYTSDAADE